MREAYTGVQTLNFQINNWNDGYVCKFQYCQKIFAQPYNDPTSTIPNITLFKAAQLAIKHPTAISFRVNLFFMLSIFALNVFHCIKNGRSIETVAKIVNFIRSRALNRRQFASFPKDLESDFEHLPFYTEARWVCCHKVLKNFYLPL